MSPGASVVPSAVAIGGRGHGAIRSHAAAARSTVASPSRRPVSCRPTGRSSSALPIGTLIAGAPVRLAG